MSRKVSVATTWLQSCGGCHIALLDLHEELLDLLEVIEIKYSPLICDIKRVPEVVIAFVEGAVANADHEGLLQELRERSDTLVALGTCACFGGLAGLRNLFHAQDVLTRAYVEAESTVEGRIPSASEVPELLRDVKPVHKVVEVDTFVPGCPPLPSMIKEAILSLIRGETPRLPTRNLCEECGRERKEMLIPKREFITEAVHAPFELHFIDPRKCFLEQGVLCMGPATREGCGARCLRGNMPCRGCMGPTPGAMEQGAKMINALASILPAGDLMFREDVVGVGYRYSLPVSIYPHLIHEEREGDG